MKRKPRAKRLVAEINITPFTDVILVLLVIFMIATPLISQGNIKVNLPVAKSGKTQDKEAKQQAEITITREGPVYLDGKLLTRRELMDQMRAFAQTSPLMNVIIRADRSVKFQDIVSILDPLSEMGLTRISMTTITEK